MMSFRMKSLTAGFLALVAIFGYTRAAGQENLPAGAATVSVAMLRVPVKARQHFEKARAAAVAGRNVEYERELAAALTIDPRFAEAYVLRASRKVILKQYEASIEDALTAQRVDPGIFWATIVHAEACNGLRRFDEAFALLDGLKPTEMGTWQAKYEMTRAVLGLGDAVAALQWSKLALAAVPPSAMPNTTLLRANAFQMAGRWPEAVEQFDQYLALPGPQPLRVQVAAVRERISKRTQESDNATVAWQE